eukprot:7381910-Prymnesium_polylepis.1
MRGRDWRAHRSSFLWKARPEVTHVLASGTHKSSCAAVLPPRARCVLRGAFCRGQAKRVHGMRQDAGNADRRLASPWPPGRGSNVHRGLPQRDSDHEPSCRLAARGLCLAHGSDSASAT